MDYANLPVGRRTRSQTSYMSEQMKEKRKAMRAAANREWKLKMKEKEKEKNSIEDDEEEEEEEFEVLDKSVYEKILSSVGSEKNPQKNDVGSVNSDDPGSFGNDDDNVDVDVDVDVGVGVSGGGGGGGGGELRRKAVEDDGESTDDSVRILEDSSRYYPSELEEEEEVGDVSLSLRTQVLSSDSEHEKKGITTRPESQVGAVVTAINSGAQTTDFELSNEQQQEEEEEDEEDDSVSDTDYRADQPELSDNLECSSSSSDEDCDREIEEDVEIVDEDVVDVAVANVGGHVLKKKDAKRKKRRGAYSDSSDYQRRIFEGLMLTAHPKNDEHSYSKRKRTRSQSKQMPSATNARDGTLRRPVVLDDDDDDDEEDEEEEIHEFFARKQDPKPQSVVENGENRKKGRLTENEKVELESPLKRKRVTGLGNSEFQRILLNTMCENGEEGLEDFMTSMDDQYLPLKFTFGKPCLPEKSEEELKLENLFRELDFGLGACNIGCDNICWV